MTTEKKSCIMEMEKFPARVFQLPQSSRQTFFTVYSRFQNGFYNYETYKIFL